MYGTRSAAFQKQYGEIELDEVEITVPSTLDDASHEDFLQKHNAIVDSLLWINTQAVSIKAGSNYKGHHANSDNRCS
jgi:predicted metal-dependent hydrolase